MAVWYEIVDDDIYWDNSFKQHGSALTSDGHGRLPTRRSIFPVQLTARSCSLSHSYKISA